MTTKIPVELSSTPGIVDGSNATAITIDSSENVGIGAVPKTTEAGWTNLSVGGMGALINSTSANAGGRTQLSNNVYVDESGNYSYISTDEASLYKQIDGIHSWHNAASGSADAHISMSEKLRIQSGGGISFNGDTAAANALDDYEEGNATLAIATSDTQFTTASQGDDSTYTRIGNQVTLFVSLSIASPSNGSGALRITGLPFTNTGAQVTTSDCNLGRIANSATQKPFGLLGNNSDVITFYYNVDGAVGAVFSATNLNGQVTPFINFTITYTT